MSDVVIHPFERVDDLQIDGLRLIQNPEHFCFGTDAVLLSNFTAASIKDGASVLDLCTGSGIVPVLLTAKSAAKNIVGVEIQPDVAEMAGRSVRLNNLGDTVKIICADATETGGILPAESFDVVCANPPYKEAGGGIVSEQSPAAIARHELLITLEDVISVAAQMLKPYGKLCMVHRPERLVDIMCIMRKYKIEPKRLTMVHPRAEKTANLILIEGAKYSRPKLFLQPPIYIY